MLQTLVSKNALIDHVTVSFTFETQNRPTAIETEISAALRALVAREGL